MGEPTACCAGAATTTMRGTAGSRTGTTTTLATGTTITGCGWFLPLSLVRQDGCLCSKQLVERVKWNG